MKLNVIEKTKEKQETHEKLAQTKTEIKKYNLNEITNKFDDLELVYESNLTKRAIGKSILQDKTSSRKKLKEQRRKRKKATRLLTKKISNKFVSVIV